MLSPKIATVICKSVRTLAQDMTQDKMVSNHDSKAWSCEATIRPPLDGLIGVQGNLLRLLIHASIPLRSTVEASAS